MATKKVNANNPLPISPQDLPEDGTPVSFTQTFARNVGTGPTDSKVPTPDDFEQAEWQVRRQTPEGWEFVDTVESRPFDQDLRDNFGAGKYEITPIDPRTGKPVPQAKVVRLISAIVTPTTGGPYPPLRDDYLPPPPPPAYGNEEMPAWMRFQMQQAAEERAEARRQAAEAAMRQREFEEKMALREFERQEREERAQRAREAKEQDEAKRKDQRMEQLIGAGVTLATTLLANRNQQPKDVNEVLLAELREARRERAPATNGMRDSLDLLIVLDKLAQNRAEMASSGRRGDDDDDGDDTSKMMMQMLPLILNGRGGGGGGGGNPLSPEMVEGMMEQAFSDPALIERIAMKNPQRTAQAFMRAVKQNPSLENAVLSAIDKDDKD